MKKLISVILIVSTMGGCATNQYVSENVEMYSGTVVKVAEVSGTVNKDLSPNSGLFGNFVGGIAGFALASTYIGIATGAIMGQFAAKEVDKTINNKQYQQVFVKTPEGRTIIYIDTDMTNYKIGQKIEFYKPIGRISKK